VHATNPPHAAKGGIKVSKRELSLMGKVIKKRLVDINKNQTWLAEKVGMNEKYLHLVLYGERSGKKRADPLKLDNKSSFLIISQNIIKSYHNKLLTPPRFQH